MKKGHNDHCHLLRQAGSGAVVVFGILSVLGSGGSGGDSQVPATAAEPPSAIKALNFDATNSVAAAQSAVSVVSFFPGFTALDRQVLALLAASDPANSPFDLAMCVNAGHSMLTWIDADHSGDMSVGDSASLQFTRCDLDGSGATTTGTVKFGLTSVDTGPLPNSVSRNVSLNLAISSDADITVFTATFGAMSSTQDDINFTDTYTAHDSSHQELSVTKNGTTLLQFGCFRITQTFSVADGAGTYQLSPSGVINDSDTIMSLADGAQLSFVGDSLESGTKRLLSSSAPNCAALGIPDGVGDSDGSYIDMVARGGGNILLQTYDAADALLYTTETTWDALLNQVNANP